MTTDLTTLRQTAQPTPTQFLAKNPGSWLQYYDDTEAKDSLKALSARSFDLDVARRKQQERCAVCFSLQAFGESRTKEGLLCFRNLGVDVDLISPVEKKTLSTEEIDRRKEDYLKNILLPFPLKPHWLTETAHGFHAIFRIRPIRDEGQVREAAALNHRLVSVLRGDLNAVMLTQVLRVPGTLQFKDPEHPFLCRLLMDNTATIAPYEVDTVRQALDTVQRGQKDGGSNPQQMQVLSTGSHDCRDGLAGVPQGQRNATAAAIVGGILGRVPEHLFETAGWGGLKEWNRRNTVPLSERELRSVYESIARRERGKRVRAGQGAEDSRNTLVIRVSVEVAGAGATRRHQGETRPGESKSPPEFSSPKCHAES